MKVWLTKFLQFLLLPLFKDKNLIYPLVTTHFYYLCLVIDLLFSLASLALVAALGYFSCPDCTLIDSALF